MKSLYQHSIDVILSNQNETGAYLASPTFMPYRYSWFRDGAYTAYAMDRVGEHDSSARFHAWAAETVSRYEIIVKRAVEKAACGERLGEGDVLHARYVPDGNVGEEKWPNFQLDGFGTWLWGLKEHLFMNGSKISLEQQHAVQLITEYLTSLWRIPCFDCWEEFPDSIHPYTLGAIYGGLKAVEEYLEDDFRGVMEDIREYILQHYFVDGHFVKFSSGMDVDASLIGLALPYRVFELNDSRIQQTIERIESTLRRNRGGVHRYTKDTYYGGGEWVVLAGWLGWYYAEIGEIDKALELLTWIESQSDANGDLPEQVPHHLNDASFFEPWCRQWGEIAQPLLWSHANYLILYKTLGLEI